MSEMFKSIIFEIVIRVYVSNMWRSCHITYISYLYYLNGEYLLERFFSCVVCVYEFHAKSLKIEVEIIFVYETLCLDPR